MKMNRSFMAVLGATTIALALAGCGGPSDSDVKDAVFTSIMKPMAATMGQPAAPSASDEKEAKASIRVQGCNKAGDNTYTCIVTGLWDNTTPTTLTLVKTDEGWAVIQQR